MRRLLALFVLMALPPAAHARKDPAEDAYQGARRGYYALKDDAKRRQLRHHWLNVVDRFEAVATKYPKSPRAPDALFTAAELLQDLSRISLLDEDLKAAISTYAKLVDTFPKHRLSDDAALALGRIYLDRSDTPERARAVLETALKTQPKGDQVPEIRSLLAKIPSKPAPPPMPKRIPARNVEPAVVASSEPAQIEAPAPAKEPARTEPASVKDSRQSALSEAFSRATAAEEKSPKSSTSESKSGTPADVRPAEAKLANVDAAAAPSGEPTGPGAKVADVRGPGAADVKTGQGAESKPGQVADAKPVETRQTPSEGSERGGSQPSDEKREVEVAQASPAPATLVLPRDRLKEAVRHRVDPQVTLAEQLGLKVRRVVIDAGHGGHDSGAIGPGGTMEKDVSLQIATRLGELLSDRGLEVILTRDDDRFVKLEDRARLANEAKGDLFISVHCNSAPKKNARGIETYSLNIASDRYSIRLAARENSSSEKGMSDLQFILADLATKANTEESTRLANRVQRSLVSGLAAKYSSIRDLGTKQALFLVLLGAKMPAILVESSFISNPEDEKRLASKEYQQKVAQAIADGVLEFLGNRQRVAKVD